VLILFMALLSFRGIDNPSLPAQGEQRRSSYFNISRGIPQALELGGNVRRGEHGTKVYFVKQLQVRDQGADDNSSTRLIPMMREYTVFNVDQCDNLPEIINTGKPMRVRNPDTRDELADAFLQSTGADIREGHALEDLDGDVARIRESRPATATDALEARSRRKPLPDHLPRKDVVLTIAEDICGCCGGALHRRKRQRDAGLGAGAASCDTHHPPEIRLPQLQQGRASGGAGTADRRRIGNASPARPGHV
jgi:hypothetical protein